MVGMITFYWRQKTKRAAQFSIRGAPLIAALPILASNLLGNLLALTHKPVTASADKPAAADVKRGAKSLP
jgi:hypothetical protein